jgi:hypothetical protein
MKKMLAFTAAIFVFTIAASIILVPSSSIGSKLAKSPAGSVIPDSINGLLEKSCFPCHSSPGNGMAMMKLNFDKWDTYSLEKQADKAQAMCKKVTAGKMPTSSFRKNNPDKVPTDKETTMLCNWANSLKTK